MTCCWQPLERITDWCPQRDFEDSDSGIPRVRRLSGVSGSGTHSGAHPQGSDSKMHTEIPDYKTCSDIEYVLKSQQDTGVGQL